MYKAPELPAAPRIVTIFPEQAIGLWVKALERPEADLKCRAADAIALAHRRNIKGLEVTIGPLRAALDREDQHPTVRLAVARTLIELDARDAAATLLKQAQAGSSQMRDLVEPALARWDYRPARATWLERLRDPATPQRRLIRTTQLLAAVGEEQAGERLLELVRSDQAAAAIRLEAARALGTLRRDGLESDGERLAGASKNLTLRLAAASLLQSHRSKEAVQLLVRLSEDPEPAVIALAAARLAEIDPDALVSSLPRLLACHDAKVRAVGVDVLLRRPTEAHLRLLADRLDDDNPEVREKARRSMKELAGKTELRQRVIEEATRLLAARGWRGLEQATILLVQLDHKPAAGRLVELLPFGRSEVFVTAAWGLRKLANPSSLPGVVRYVEAEERQASRKGDLFKLTDHQLAQLHQFLGQQKYKPADAVLRRYVPRRPDEAWPEARAAAIWALGTIHENKPSEDVVAILEERLNDTNQLPIEDERVRRMAAVSLGRVRAESALPSLQKNCLDHRPPADSVGTACHWAIEKLTGERMLPPKTVQRRDRDWFLVPAE
jgi:HEAT repeat protein